MAAPEHLLYTPEQAANSTLAALRYQSTLARLVSTGAGVEFVAGRGSSVSIRRPILIEKAKVHTAEDRAAENPIQYSNLLEPYTSVKLSDQVYNAVKLPDYFTTFELSDLETQVIAPMAQSVADHLNQVVVDALNTIPSGLSAIDKAPAGQLVDTDGKAYQDLNALRKAGKEFAGFGASGVVSVKAADLKATYADDILPTIRAAHQLLSQRGVANVNRVLVVGANWEAGLLGHQQLQKVNEAGDQGGLLRNATLGNLFGFTIVADYTIGANDAFAFQREGVALVTRTTAAPRGAAFSSTASADGFTLRYLQDYDPNILTDRAVTDTFAGAQVLDPQRVVRLTGADSLTEKSPAAAAPAAS